MELCAPIIHNFYNLLKKDQEQQGKDSDLEDEIDVVSGKCIDVVKALVSAPHTPQTHQTLMQLVFPLIDFNLKSDEHEFLDEIYQLLSCLLYQTNQSPLD